MIQILTTVLANTSSYGIGESTVETRGICVKRYAQNEKAALTFTVRGLRFLIGKTFHKDTGYKTLMPSKSLDQLPPHIQHLPLEIFFIISLYLYKNILHKTGFAGTVTALSSFLWDFFNNLKCISLLYILLTSRALDLSCPHSGLNKLATFANA